jgi:hypothetical protein
MEPQMLRRSKLMRFKMFTLLFLINDLRKSLAAAR